MKTNGGVMDWHKHESKKVKRQKQVVVTLISSSVGKQARCDYYNKWWVGRFDILSA